MKKKSERMAEKYTEDAHINGTGPWFYSDVRDAYLAGWRARARADLKALREIDLGPFGCTHMCNAIAAVKKVGKS